MNRKICETIFRRFKAKNPHPKTELNYQSPFELLVATILSAQATDTGVNKATRILFKVAKTPQAFLKLGLKKLKTYIKSIGLYNTKAKNILATCKILVQNDDAKIPNTREALETLPGVGRKTANILLNVLFDQPTLPVDTHIFRVANRIGLAHGKTPLAVEKQLLQIIPPKYLKNAHHWLVLHGRYICVARRPKCPECFIRDLCEYPHKTTTLDESSKTG